MEKAGIVKQDQSLNIPQQIIAFKSPVLRYNNASYAVMTSADLLILNFEEIRRRSISIWKTISPECYSWRPDIGAMTLLEMVRHVLESEHPYHIIMERGG